MVGWRRRPAFPQEPAINTAIRRTARLTVAATACALALTTGLTACGTVKQLTAGEKIADAFDKLGDGKTFKAELSVDATADQLVAFGKAVDDPIERNAAEALADLSLTVSVSAKKPLKDVEDFKKAQAGGDYNALATSKDVDLAYEIGGKKSGKNYLDFRIVGGKGYLKVDARGVAQLAGEPTTGIDEMSAAMPPSFKVAKDLLDGKWISFDPALMEELSKQAESATGKASASPSAVPSLDPKAVEGFGKALKDVFAKNVTLEDRGASAGLQQIHVSANARPIVEGFLKAAKPLVKDLPTDTPLPDSAPATVPDRKVGADVYLRDGALSHATFDIAQLTDKAGPEIHFPIRIGFGRDVPAIEAPGGATEVTKKDIEDLTKGFGEMAGGDLEDGGPTTAPGDAAPLTDAQLAELAKLGMNREQAKAMNEAGFTFEELKEFVQLKS
ncbi:hypothetical protein ACGFX4_31035 [Kitasatospora sp. NPDC048365]|uniref:hypothetical protein n=1 Tax=Kitasatospora sp. NPDC048365 TaxID=3364050 RepID=UPI0037138A4C